MSNLRNSKVQVSDTFKTFSLDDLFGSIVANNNYTVGWPTTPTVPYQPVIDRQQFYYDVGTLITPPEQFVVETSADGITLSVDIPGTKPGDFSVETEGSVIHVTGKRKEASFSYKYTLPKKFDASSGAATYENGVLSLTFLKREDEKPRKIVVDIK